MEKKEGEQTYEMMGEWRKGEKRGKREEEEVRGKEKRGEGEKK